VIRAVLTGQSTVSGFHLASFSSLSSNCLFVFSFSGAIYRRRCWYPTLRLRSTIRRHHPPHSAVLSHTCCLVKRKVVVSQILLDMMLYRHLKIFLLHSSLYLIVRWAWWYWPLTWLTNRRHGRLTVVLQCTLVILALDPVD